MFRTGFHIIYDFCTAKTCLAAKHVILLDMLLRKSIYFILMYVFSGEIRFLLSYHIRLKLF